jgi:tetratricopeptide (TPR) repeat protein
MVLNWSGEPVDPNELASDAYTPGREGSLQLDILSAARRHGRLPYPVSDLESLLAEVEAGHPVLVLQNLGLGLFPVWHFAVTIGYDLTHGIIILHSGRHAGRHVSLHTFERTWSRGGHWAVAVLPAGEMPATAQEAAYLEAIIGLERAERWAEARVAYEAATRRWPESLGAWLGLGNSHHALSDVDGAEEAFRAAVQADPDAGEALNNLAHVLLERGERDEAHDIIKRALGLGGPMRPVFERTLREIERAGR